MGLGRAGAAASRFAHLPRRVIAPAAVRGALAILPAAPPLPDAATLDLLEPEVRTWFTSTFAVPTPPQRYALREVAAGRNVLVVAPTGAGKTLAAFLVVLSDLVGKWKRGALDDRVHVVYVSPLKALGNDIERNLRAPLDGIRQVFEDEGRAAPPIRVAVRNGDTSTSERQAMARKPPHILLTTPESLALALASPRLGKHLEGVRHVVVDEVHALAASKRGTHLALSLERLASVAGDPVRIGLSATVAPLEGIAAFLFGGRAGIVADATAEKGLDLEVRCPVRDSVAAPIGEARDALDGALEGLVRAHATTLVFTNTRAATERVAFRLRERLDAHADGQGVVGLHHGSLSREVRLDTEARLKAGDLRCVVSSTSLELGIDIGSVDCVALLGSPKGVSRALQRVGRSGHRLTEVSRGRFLVLDRDDLVECLVIAREARARRVDPVKPPNAPLDVLAQQLLGLALGGEQTVAGALALVRRAWPYRDLPDVELRAALRYLARNRTVWFDEESGAFRPRGLSRVVYFRNVGTIPSSAMVKVHHGNRYLGELEESYVEALEQGDIFTLNGSAWDFRHASGMKAWVDPAPGRRPTVPRWGTESLPLPPELAREVARFRDEAADILEMRGEPGLAESLRASDGLDEPTADAVARYFAEQAAFSRIPVSDEIVVEESVDDEERRLYVVHACFGRRANEAIARALARTLAVERRVGVGVAASDQAFSLTVPRSLVLSGAAIRRLFEPEIRPRLLDALHGGELVKRRFRHVAERALLLAKTEAGESAGGRQVSAHKLYHALRRYEPDHLVLRETWREVLEDALDLATAERVRKDVLAGRLKVRLLGNLRTPSPFAFHIVALGQDDGVLFEDRKAVLKDLQERVQERLRERARAD